MIEIKFTLFKVNSTTSQLLIDLFEAAVRLIGADVITEIQEPDLLLQEVPHVAAS